jgi:hypothetical protein
VSAAREALIRARAKVESGWSQGAYARNSAGHIVSADHPFAVAFCPAGAIIAETPFDVDTWRAAHAAFRRALGITSLFEWNDAPSRTRADVLAAFDRAIAAACS